MFLSGLLGGGGSSEPSPQEDGHSSVERIVDRLDTAAMLPDRREACKMLRALAKVGHELILHFQFLFKHSSTSI